MQIPTTILALAVSAVIVHTPFDFFAASFGTPGKNASCDYVIIGGGTGGLAIEARLAENKDTSVSVIEAGGLYQVDNGEGRWLLPGASDIGLAR